MVTPEEISPEETLEKIKACVDAVFKFRDEFVSVRGLSAASLRDKEVEAKLKEAMVELDALAQHSELQAGAQLGRVCYERGRLLSCCPSTEAQAEQHLGRASKFGIPGAWTLLGECLYAKGDLPGATTCFNRTLSTGDDKVALRNLSMLMRAMPSQSPEHREKNINKGVEYARRAVKCDPGDGRSWMVLGNALLSAFFAVHASTTTLQACRAAYARAEQDKSASQLPELHFSKFQVAWYEEQYGPALDSLRTAWQLEPCWAECASQRQQCMTFLRSLDRMVKGRGNLANKRLQTMIKNIRSSQLGPYEQSGTALTGSKQPELVTFQQLQPGTNTDKIVQGMVVSTLVPESGIPFVMCLVDAEGSCLPVTVYNWAPGTEVKIGDAVAVLAPVLKEQKILLQEEEEQGGAPAPAPAPAQKGKSRVSAKQQMKRKPRPGASVSETATAATSASAAATTSAAASAPAASVSAAAPASAASAIAAVVSAASPSAAVVSAASPSAAVVSAASVSAASVSAASASAASASAASASAASASAASASAASASAASASAASASAASTSAAVASASSVPEGSSEQLKNELSDSSGETAANVVVKEETNGTNASASVVKMEDGCEEMTERSKINQQLKQKDEANQMNNNKDGVELEGVVAAKAVGCSEGESNNSTGAGEGSAAACTADCSMETSADDRAEAAVKASVTNDCSTSSTAEVKEEEEATKKLVSRISLDPNSNDKESLTELAQTAENGAPTGSDRQSGSDRQAGSDAQTGSDVQTGSDAQTGSDRQTIDTEPQTSETETEPLSKVARKETECPGVSASSSRQATVSSSSSKPRLSTSVANKNLVNKNLNLVHKDKDGHPDKKMTSTSTAGAGTRRAPGPGLSDKGRKTARVSAAGENNRSSSNSAGGGGDGKNNVINTGVSKSGSDKTFDVKSRLTIGKKAAAAAARGALSSRKPPPSTDDVNSNTRIISKTSGDSNSITVDNATNTSSHTYSKHGSNNNRLSNNNRIKRGAVVTGTSTTATAAVTLTTTPTTTAAAPTASSKTKTTSTLNTRSPSNTTITTASQGSNVNSSNNSSSSSKKLPTASTTTGTSNSAKKNRMSRTAAGGGARAAAGGVAAAEPELLLRSIRVVAPVMLVVNKRVVTASQVAASYIVSQNKPE